MTPAPVLAPRERPILFSAPMVLAILDGRKTVTRRLSSRYQVGDLLYVKETYSLHRIHDSTRPSKVLPTLLRSVTYRADGEERDGRWRPSIHMPKWASRIWLEVVSVRKERLQDITEEGAKAEGIAELYGFYGGGVSKDGIPRVFASARLAFADLWDRIHGEGAWASNPEVYAIEFRRVK